MDCKYILENDIHEKYLKDQLSDSEKREYLKHIKICTDCAKDLAKEEKTISLIRAVGKRQMKSEIRFQVEQLRNKKTSSEQFPMILKVAAVIFFLVLTPALIYHYNQMPVDNFLTYGPEKLDDIARTENAEAEIEDESIDEESAGEDITEQIQKQEMRSSERGTAKKAARAKVSGADESTDIQTLLETETSIATGKGAGAVSEDVGSAVEGAGVTDQLSMMDLESKAERRSAASEMKMKAMQQEVPQAAAEAAPVAMSKESDTKLKTHEFNSEGKTIIFNFYYEEIETEDETPYGMRIQGIEKDSSAIVLVCTVNRSFFELDDKELKVTLEDTGKVVLEIIRDYKFIININDNPPVLRGIRIDSK